MSLPLPSTWSGWLPGERARSASTPELLDLVLTGGHEKNALVELIGRSDDGLGDRDATGSTLPSAPGEGTTLILAAMRELVRRLDAPAYPTRIRGPADVAAIAVRELSGREHERLLVIACDAANRPVATVTVAVGGIDRCLFPVREVLGAVLRRNGRAFAVAHNHPSGEAHASEADLTATLAVVEAARVIGLRFLGHVVVAEGDWVSVTPQPPRTPR